MPSDVFDRWIVIGVEFVKARVVQRFAIQREGQLVLLAQDVEHFLQRTVLEVHSGLLIEYSP